MADKIQIRAGNKSGMPTLTDRELAYVRDENALYIGTPDGNKKVSAEAAGGGGGGGLYAFEITEDGYLQCIYTDGDAAPRFSINDYGYLVAEI